MMVAYTKKTEVEEVKMVKFWIYFEGKTNKLYLLTN